mmetsp:Transcript_45758/g.133232  ORF Transcript_45758/g.133232 Transcript_45758/m.133232 type:complete len:103 (-) Transcript_45758:453-761(-)
MSEKWAELENTGDFIHGGDAAETFISRWAAAASARFAMRGPVRVLPAVFVVAAVLTSDGELCGQPAVSASHSGISGDIAFARGTLTALAEPGDSPHNDGAFM